MFAQPVATALLSDYIVESLYEPVVKDDVTQLESRLAHFKKAIEAPARGGKGNGNSLAARPLRTRFLDFSAHFMRGLTTSLARLGCCDL